MHNPLCNNNSTANTPGRNFSISRGPALTKEPWGDRYELGLWFLSCATSIKHWFSPCLRCPFCGYATQGWRWLVCLQSRQISTNLLCWACWKQFPSCTRWLGFLCLRSMGSSSGSGPGAPPALPVPQNSHFPTKRKHSQPWWFIGLLWISNLFFFQSVGWGLLQFLFKLLEVKRWLFLGSFPKY